jgi:tetratricopeptide (TPR) repeat protein
MKRAPAVSGYSLEDLQTLLGLEPARVRAWMRAGFLAPREGPDGAPRFAFQDLVLLRAAQGLSDAGVPERKVRQALRGLRERLPQGRPLASLRICAEGSQILVREGEEAWDPVSGQALLDFEVADLAREARPLAERAAAAARDSPEELPADEWFALGLELEAAAPAEARDAYRRALTADPDHPDAHLNLGRLLHEEGAVADAERHYRRAAALRPADATAAYNLGVALEDLGRPADAAQAYERALAADPACADAHFNLAGILEKRGDKALALRHLMTYRELVRRAGAR